MEDFLFTENKISGALKFKKDFDEIARKTSNEEFNTMFQRDNANKSEQPSDLHAIGIHTKPYNPYMRRKKTDRRKNSHRFFRVDIEQNSLIKENRSYVVHAKNIIHVRDFILSQYLGTKVSKLRKMDKEACVLQNIKYVHIDKHNVFSFKDFNQENQE